jgi:hypothetical protein
LPAGQAYPPLAICPINRACNMHNAHSMELLGRIATAFGISLVLTLLLLLIYQDDSAQAANGPSSATIAESR